MHWFESTIRDSYWTLLLPNSHSRYYDELIDLRDFVADKSQAWEFFTAGPNILKICGMVVER